MRIRVYVTKKNLREGQPSDGSHCAVKKALDRYFTKVAGVGRETAQFDPYGSRPKRINLPESVKEKILQYDRLKRSVKPFSFVLDVPKRFVRAAYQCKSA